MSESFNVRRSFFMNWTKNWKVPIWFKRKNKNFQDFQVFDFALYPKIENSEITESFLLLKFSVLHETQNLKTDWKMTPPPRPPAPPIKKKNVNFIMWFEKKKCKFPRFPSFRLCLIPKIENSEILESFLLLKFLVVYETQNLKTDWKMTQNLKSYLFEKKKCPFPKFPSFWFCPILEIENFEILESFHLLQIFIVSITLSMGKVKTFHWISD